MHDEFGRLALRHVCEELLSFVALRHVSPRSNGTTYQGYFRIDGSQKRRARDADVLRS